MNRPPERSQEGVSTGDDDVRSRRKRLRGLLLGMVALAACFAGPLADLFRFAFQNDLYSHIILIPLISFYLVREKRKVLAHHYKGAVPLAFVFAIFGGLLLVAQRSCATRGNGLAMQDSLAFTTASFLLFSYGLCVAFLGRVTARQVAFPLGFLVFMVPLPLSLSDWIVVQLQKGSALAADAMFNVVGTPVVFGGLSFRLQGISIEVAPQCSGIHSTLALFVTSVLAANLFLRSPWKGLVLTAAVVPLAMIRNGLRIFTIGELCVHIGPQMINSYIHHHGGPIFFIVSLVPFFLLLFLLSRSDRRSSSAVASSPHS